MTLTVKNVSPSRAAQSVEGCGHLAYGATGRAEENDHTRALIEAGHLVEIEKPQRKQRQVSDTTKQED